MIFVSDVCFRTASFSLTAGQLYLYRLDAFRDTRTEMFYSGIENPSSPRAILRPSPGHLIPIKRVSMKTRRFAGLAIQEDPSRFLTPSQTVFGLYPELLRWLPVGIALLFLKDPSHAQSFRIAAPKLA